MILKNHVCKGATDEEMKYCLAVAGRYQLDPFKQEIWFVPRWDSKAVMSDGKKGGLVYTPTVGISGLLHIAARDHRDFGTFSKPIFGPMVTITYHKNGDGPLLKFQAPEWCEVSGFKKGSVEPTTAQLWFEEIYPNVDYSPMVRQMPRHMLAKCTKANVIRTNYPRTGGLTIPEEQQGKEFTDITPGRRLLVRGEPEGIPAAEPTPEPILPCYYCAATRPGACLERTCPRHGKTPAQWKAVDAEMIRIQDHKKQPADQVIDVEPKPDNYQGITIQRQTDGSFLVDGPVDLKHEHRALLLGPRRCNWSQAKLAIVLPGVKEVATLRAELDRCGVKNREIAE